jgi:FtsP/CotA-like multicopper oxidase with cupredoxin domain
MPRAILPPRYDLNKLANNSAQWINHTTNQIVNELPAKNWSYHNDYNASGGTAYKNPATGVGSCEGRPDGEFFAHQRWDELFPKYGFLLSIGQIKSGSKFNSAMPAQAANAVWSFGARTPGMRANIKGTRTANAAPMLVKLRYGEPCVTRIYNDLPISRAENGGFGRNEMSTHFHNAHNGAESDGACNAYHFPGTFYDYHWGTTMARRDMPSVWPTNVPGWMDKCSGTDDGDDRVLVPGDFRECQGSMWFHDHRFFFTAENVHKGVFALCNMYSAPDRGREGLNDGFNLQLPSGNALPWGNVDFDVNISISNPAFKPDGQLFFDIFDTDGFLGDMLLVNGSYYPYLEVLPRRYRLRTINASMARFIKLALVVQKASSFAAGTKVPFHFIANDGNFVVKPLLMDTLDEQGVAERYDIVVDFSKFKPGDTIYLVNLLKQTDGRKPAGALSVAQALAGVSDDPCVGPILQFRVVPTMRSVDDPSVTYDYSVVNGDRSVDLSTSDWGPQGSKVLTHQIPIEAPVRERVIEWGRSGGGDSRDNPGGVCIPECGDIQSFPWSVKVNGQEAHTLNANRISALIPKPGEVEHWTYINGGGGWDHPIHLHFEEGVTMDRGGAFLPETERLARKDVWRLRPGGRVKFQVRFGEFGGAYVNHCHNTIHEDFAMLLRYQLLTPPPGDPDYKGLPHFVPTRTPIPGPRGVTWKDPEILPEADPRSPNYIPPSGGGSGTG